MARPVTVPQDRDLAILITLGIPVGIVVTLFLEIRGPRFNVWALTAYTAFLGTYLCWILGYEYALFGDLHSLKSRPADTLLLGAVFGGILQVSRTAGAVDKSLLWLGAFLSVLVIWEAYTMLSGYNRYFRIRSAGAHFAILDLARRPATGEMSPDRVSHWHEYRYWILLDSALCLIVGAGSAASGHLLKVMSAGQMNLSIAAIGCTIGVVNTLRYKVLVRRIRALREVTEHT